MPILIDPYQSFLNKGIKVEPLKAELQKAQINGLLSVIDTDLYEVQSGDTIPAFQHPVIFKNGSNQDVVCIDTRVYRTKDYQAIVQNNIPEFEFQVLRGRLTKNWLKYDKKFFTSVLDDAMKIYVYWISGAIARRFSLTPNESMVIDVLLGFNFVNMFNQHESLDEINRLAFVQRFSRVFPLHGPNFVENIINDIPRPYATLPELVNDIKTKSGSVRLNSLNAGVLYTLIGNTWMGYQAPVILSTAIEHVPTFYALIYSAAKETMYRKTGFTQVVDKVASKSKGDLVLQIDSLAKNQY